MPATVSILPRVGRSAWSLSLAIKAAHDDFALSFTHLRHISFFTFVTSPPHC